MEFTDSIFIRYSNDKFYTNHLGIWSERRCLKCNVADNLFFLANDIFCFLAVATSLLVPKEQYTRVGGFIISITRLMVPIYKDLNKEHEV